MLVSVTGAEIGGLFFQLYWFVDAAMAAEKAKMKTAQAKRMVPLLMKMEYLLEDVKATVDSASEEEPLNMVKVTAMGTALTDCKAILTEEIRMQKVADKGGKIGWKAVKVSIICLLVFKRDEYYKKM